MLQLKNISLLQFKNYQQADFRLTERITGICGSNGIGKTNLLDAIYYLCFTKSYFAKSDQQNVQQGSAGFRVAGQFELNGEMEETVCILRETGRKEFSVNERLYEKFSAHIGRFPCVIITPDDVQMIALGSEERRRFIDTLLCQLDAKYLQFLIDYNRILQQRNSFLKSLAEKRTAPGNLLDVYDEQLTKTGLYVFEQRTSFLQQLLPLVKKMYAEIAGREEQVELFYGSQLQTHPFATLLQQFRDKDMLLQRTNAGIHKDDIEITLNGLPFKNSASQGQRKSLLFAMKLGEFEILKKEKGFPPILLLDDVFEKLDENRMYNLLEKVGVKNEGQLFITDTHRERICRHFDNLQVKYQLIQLPTTA